MVTLIVNGVTAEGDSTAQRDERWSLIVLRVWQHGYGTGIALMGERWSR